MGDRAPPKPREGSPCNGCGLCCSIERCEAAIMAIGEGPTPCPLLKFARGRFWCSLVWEEQARGMEPLIARALGIGNGCLVDDAYPPVTATPSP